MALPDLTIRVPYRQGDHSLLSSVKILRGGRWDLHPLTSAPQANGVLQCLRPHPNIPINTRYAAFAYSESGKARTAAS